MKIKGYENYEVTCSGDVLNSKTGRVLKPAKGTGGYLFVSLSKNGKEKPFLIHRLVAEAFIPNPLNLPQVNHRDEDKTNNTVDNLEWCTAEYNTNYGTAIERRAKKQINTKQKSKTVLQLKKDGSLVRIWPSVAEIKRQLGYLVGNIAACCRGERHLAYGFKWSYTSNPCRNTQP